MIDSILNILVETLREYSFGKVIGKFSKAEARDVEKKRERKGRREIYKGREYQSSGIDDGGFCRVSLDGASDVCRCLFGSPLPKVFVTMKSRKLSLLIGLLTVSGITLVGVIVFTCYLYAPPGRRVFGQLDTPDGLFRVDGSSGGPIDGWGYQLYWKRPKELWAGFYLEHDSGRCATPGNWERSPYNSRMR